MLSFYDVGYNNLTDYLLPQLGMNSRITGTLAIWVSRRRFLQALYTDVIVVWSELHLVRIMHYLLVTFSSP